MIRIHYVRRKSIFNKSKKRNPQRINKKINKKGVSITKCIYLLMTLEKLNAGKPEMKISFLCHLLVECLTAMPEWSSFTWDALGS